MKQKIGVPKGEVDLYYSLRKKGFTKGQAQFHLQLLKKAGWRGR